MSKIHSYPLIIKETYLDSFGHVNNAVYLTLFEEARWDLLTTNGYDLKKIKETGLGPVILEINLKFSKELRGRDEIVIQTELISYEKKIAVMIQKMWRGEELCCTMEMKFGLFSLNERKLVMPTPEWLKAMGIYTEHDSKFGFRQKLTLINSLWKTLHLTEIQPIVLA
jgi:acyl-CoA thioester hydrolase